MKRTQPVVGVGERVTVGCNDGAGDGCVVVGSDDGVRVGNGVGCGVGAMTGDAVGLPGVAVGSGVGRGVGSGAGADDDGADDGIDDGDGWLLRFFLLSEDTPKTYPNAPAQAMTTANPASSHLLLFHLIACFRAIPPGSCPYLKSEGFNTTIE